MTDLIRRKQAGEAWETAVDTGGGGSQTLAQVLATGGDPDGNPITGPLAISPTGDAGDAAVTVAPAGAKSGMDVRSGPGWSGQIASFFDDTYTYGLQVSDVGLATIFLGDAASQALRIAQADDSNNDIFTVGPTGAVTISPSDPAVLTYLRAKAPVGAFDANGEGIVLTSEDDVDVAVLDVWGNLSLTAPPTQGSNLSVSLASSDEPGTYASLGPNGFFAEREPGSLITASPFMRFTTDSDIVHSVGPTGAVTISPSDPAVRPLTVRGADLFSGTTIAEFYNTNVDGFGLYVQATGKLLTIGDGIDRLLELGGEGGSALVSVGPTGAVTISPSDGAVHGIDILPAADSAAASLLVQGHQGTDFWEAFSVGHLGQIVHRVWAGAGSALSIFDADNLPIVTVGPSGAVTISPTAVDANGNLLGVLGHAGMAAGQLFQAFDSSSTYGMNLYWDGGMELHAQDTAAYALRVTGGSLYDNLFVVTGANEIGFFGATPAAQPTGVAVNAAGIHAALVTLGLITA